MSKISKERVDAQNVGAIVMNCNPFTLGHRHLVEFARRDVDFLYVFVVEEDKSAIPFKERFAIACENCAAFDNVKVLPSGKFIISSVTFAEYFQKDELQNSRKIYPAQDVRLFGREIAPALGITKRFVGEEPFDAVTRQYNEAMEEILPEYGVELVEIPRLKSKDGEVISATKVRDFLRRDDLKSCRPYLTEETYRYLRRKGKRILR